MSPAQPISIIIPTTAATARASTLQRALASLATQLDARARAIVVVNGSRADPEVVRALAENPNVTLIRREEGNLPLALAAGREAVDTTYFGVLDDDDEYLPSALSLRRQPMDRDGTIDAVVGNGFLAGEAGDEVMFADIESYEDAPLVALTEGNWLPSCAGLFRTTAVGPNWFVDMPKFLEWTYFATRLCLHHRVTFLGQPTYRIWPGSPGSLSGSIAYILRMPEAIEKIIALGLPPQPRRTFESKLRASLHTAASQNLKDGKLADAWRCHLRSLRGIDALRYLAFTRHLVAQHLGLPN